MNALIALYIKELKDNRNLFLFLLAGSVVLDAWALWTVETQVLAILICGLPALVTMFLLPFLLASSFTSEWRANTNQLVLSLPVRTSLVGFGKYLAVLSMGIVLYAVAAGAVYGVLMRSPDATVQQIPNLFGWTKANAFTTSVLIYFSYLFLLLGIVCGMEGIKFTVKRFRGLVAAGFFVGGLYLYSHVVSVFFQVLAPEWSGGMIVVLSSIFSGFLYLGLGLFLFEKYVEL